MFVQIIQGRAGEPDELREAFDQWYRDLAPDARGWLGTAAGMTPEGEFIGLARFESADAAKRNSQRPEQHQWWVETSKLFAGDVQFTDCTNVVTFLAGGSDEAGFVQVLQGEVRDTPRSRELIRELERLKEFRPELIGGIDAVHPDGRHFTQSCYFTSEAEAREGEQKELPPELAQTMMEGQEIYRDIRYFDLTEPWLYSPAEKHA